MIPTPSDVRVWLAVGRTDMRRGMNGLALQVQEALQRDPHAGDLFVFRGARGDLIKILWHDGLGLSLYAKRLERGRFVWPPSVAASSIQARTAEERAVSISSAPIWSLRPYGGVSLLHVKTLRAASLYFLYSSNC